jgi:rhamnulokinase
MLEQLGIPLRLLPEVLQPGTVVGCVHRSILRSCGFEKEIPAIAVASHDTASAVAAIPHMDDCSAFISSGTWSLMGVEVDQPNTSELARRLQFTNEGSVTGGFFLMKNLTGLWLLQECLQHWALQGRTYSWTEVMEAAAGAVPFRAVCDPNDKRLQVQSNMPEAIQSYCRDTGQPLPESLGEFARFAFESLSLKYRSVLHALELLTGRDLHTVRIVGGGSLNGCLCQMIADALGCTVVSGPAEASALGNVMMQAIATGCLSDLQAGRAAIAESVACTTFHPCPSCAWVEAFARFRDLEVG